MGRRALRKIDPDLDLLGHLLGFEQLPRPWQTSAAFGREGPLEVEVGSGKGLFLRTEPETRPTVNFLGIEIAGKYARFAAASAAQRGIANVRIVHGDAMRVFAEVLPESAVQAVHVYFPDPWWKKRHKKRRVMQQSFLADVERALSPGGRLHFWTDVEEYFQTTLALLRTATRLEGPFDVAERPAGHDLDYRTHFERRMRRHREAVYRAEFVRAG